MARGLTERDRFICETLYEHRVLTTNQVEDLAFDRPERARLRLVALYRAHVLDRFRPLRATGSAPYHYVLDSLGVAICAAERGVDPERLAFVPQKALRWSRSQRLAHLVGVNGLFTALVRAARHSRGRAALEEWWSEQRCAAAMAGLVRPDGYGVWAEDGARVEFCLEYDRGTERVARVVRKLDGYQDLETASGVRRWALFVLPTTRREADLRRAIGSAPVPTATALATGDPAGAVWLPVGEDQRRRLLGELPQVARHAGTQGP